MKVDTVITHIIEKRKTELRFHSWKDGRFRILLFFFFKPHLWHMENSWARDGIRAAPELQLQVYATATATLDLSCICNLCHSLWQCWILNPLSEARDQIHIPRQVCYHCTTMGTPCSSWFFSEFLTTILSCPLDISNYTSHISKSSCLNKIHHLLSQTCSYLGIPCLGKGHYNPSTQVLKEAKK